MRCDDCGFENPVGSKFCGKCGKPLVQEWTYNIPKEIGKIFYKKLLPVAMLGILLLGYWVIAPNIINIFKTLEPAIAPLSASPVPTDSKTAEPSPTPIPTSQFLSGTASPTSTQVLPASRTIILEPNYAERAGIWSSGYVDWQWVVGDAESGDYAQTFLSYSVADIPINATITEAALDFSKYRRSGDPFSYLGCMGVYEQFFGAPDAKDFFFGTPTDAIAKWCSDGELSSRLKSKNLASALQNKLGKNMFQIRLQFDKDTDNNKQSDNIVLGNTNPAKIIVTYTLP